jgi:hypothetical protein
MRWFSERSGAPEGLEVMVEDIGPVAVGMGGESTGPGAPFKTNLPNSYEAQVELYLCRGWWMVGGRFCRGFPNAQPDRCRHSGQARSPSGEHGRQRLVPCIQTGL